MARQEPLPRPWTQSDTAAGNADLSLRLMRNGLSDVKLSLGFCPGFAQKD
jgi:hypothetical protein